MQIKNSVIVITGGASGIGKAAALALAKQGAKIVIGDLNEEAMNEVVAEIKSENGEAIALPTNVSKEEEVAALMDTAVQNFGAINVVIPSAGLFRDAFFISPDRETGKVRKFMTAEQFRLVVDVNLTGTFLTLREAAIRMIDNDWQGVLFTISSINKEGQLGQLNYSSTKVALGLFPKILTGEFHAKKIHGIRVAGIAPGYVETPILQGMKPEVVEGIVKDVAINRLIKVEEIVSTIQHVIENDAITGTTIEVAGGVIAKGLAK